MDHRSLDTPKEYALKILGVSSGDYYSALRYMCDVARDSPDTPSRFWADTVIELNELCKQ